MFKYKNTTHIISSLIVFLFLTFNLFATTQKAQEALDKAVKESKKKDWRSAADYYKAARLYSDDYVVKANALKREAEAYRKAKLYYKEFECLKLLAENAPDQIDFEEVINREYEIANLYYKGYREKPYPWLPWIEDNDHAIEIYESIQLQSPYAKFMPNLLLSLGYLHLRKSDNEKAIESYKTIISKYPNSSVTDLAYLELANIHLKLAERGDGDGSHTKAAGKALAEFIDKFPDSKEKPWAQNALKEANELSAERLWYLAKYYAGKGNDKATERYIREIIINYPETRIVKKAERKLDSIEMPLYPTAKSADVEKIVPSKYQIKSLPVVEKKVSVIPENSENKWLVPITETSIKQNKRTESKYKDML